MMKVKVKFFGPIRDLFGGREVEIVLPPGAPFRELLRRLSDNPEREKEIFAAADAGESHLVIMKNGRPVPRPEGLDAPLQDGDTIAIFPFMGGG
ncbi:MAG: MoaD family protein [Candidatus Aminicenantes bacterium]|nr:MoaD family protein [Candidatus Aminicenantes bacterium]